MDSMTFTNDTLVLSQNHCISTKNTFLNDNFPIKNPIQKEKSRVNLKTAFHLDLSKMKFLDIEINSNKKKYKTINVVKPKNKTRKFNFEKGENSIIQNNKPKIIKKDISRLNLNHLQLKRVNRSSISIKDKSQNQSDIKIDKLGKESTIKESDIIFKKKMNINNKNCSCVCKIF